MRFKSVLAFSVSIAAVMPAVAHAEGAESDIVVTGYGVKDAVTGTKTDTPVIEVPQSIAVITEELIRDRRPVTLTEALYNVSGVADSGSRRGFDNFTIRGFPAATSAYLDGLRIERGNYNVAQELYGLERVEVLKGPGSVLFGQGSLGGIVNLVSKRPGTTPVFDLDVMGGSFGTWEGAIDVGGALNADGSVTARLNGVYRELGDSIDYNDKQRIYVSPALGLKSGGTSVTLLANYTRDRHDGSYVGIPVLGTVQTNPNGRIDRSLYIGEPGNDGLWVDRFQIGYQLEQKLGSNWRLRQNTRYSTTDVVSRATFSQGLAAGQSRRINRGTAIFELDDQSTTIDTNIEGKFTTGPIEHTLLFGADLLFQSIDSKFTFGSFPQLDVFAPVYGGVRGPTFPVENYVRDDKLYGFYAQDQLKIGERLTILIGGRYDIAKTDSLNRLNNVRREQKDKDFTWRAGAVYQVVPGLGLFASYSEAFNPNFGLSQQGVPFDAETGKQYEGGIKADLADGRIRGTLAVYELTRDNVIVAFPNLPGVQVQTGQQRSRGVEADIAVKVSDRLNVTGAYAHTDVKVMKDENPALLGDRPLYVPRNQASLWANYEIPIAADQRLTIGAGGRYVGERQGTLPNSYMLPGYTIFDAAISYRMARWRFQVNAYNLLDKNYIDSSSPTGIASVLVGEPLTVRARIGYSF